MIVQPARPQLIKDGILAQRELARIEAGGLGGGFNDMRGMGQFPLPGAGGGAGSDYLDGVVASTCCDLDATISASYGGSGETWSNLVVSPADGAAQTDYDAWLGVDGGAGTDNPTFTGSAGSASAYFAMDGGDFFNFKSVTAPLTIYNMHRKTGGTNAWWIAAACYEGSDALNVWWGRGWNGGNHGMYFYRTTTDIVFYQDGTSPSLTSYATGVNLAGTTHRLGIVSIDMESTTNNVRWWFNNRTGTTVSKTWSNQNSNPTVNFYIGGSRDTANRGLMTNGSRYYSFAVGNEFLDDTKAGLIFDHLNDRHGRTYA